MLRARPPRSDSRRAGCRKDRRMVDRLSTVGRFLLVPPEYHYFSWSSHGYVQPTWAVRDPDRKIIDRAVGRTDKVAPRSEHDDLRGAGLQTRWRQPREVTVGRRRRTPISTASSLPEDALGADFERLVAEQCGAGGGSRDPAGAGVHRSEPDPVHARDPRLRKVGFLTSERTCGARPCAPSHRAWPRRVRRAGAAGSSGAAGRGTPPAR
jgi:hypothetical protein